MKCCKAYYLYSSSVGISGVAVGNDFSQLVNLGDEAILRYSLSKVGIASVSLWTVDGKNIMNHLTSRQLAGEYAYNIPLYSLNDGIKRKNMWVLDYTLVGQLLCIFNQ